MRKSINLTSKTMVNRRGIAWSLDLREGIDLAIYIAGGFELSTLSQYRKLVKNGDVIFDIGANIGAHTLPLASLVGPAGKIFAFEPTSYAFTKLSVNLSLNPNLKPRVDAHQIMLTACTSDPLPSSIFSSWPLEKGYNLHTHHCGRLMKTNGARKDTLNDFVRKNNINKLNLIKLDVDGYEYDVLSGATEVLIKLKPKIMIELAPYVYEKSPEEFDLMLRLLWKLGYQLSDVSSRALLPECVESIKSSIPKYGSINALANPG